MLRGAVCTQLVKRSIFNVTVYIDKGLESGVSMTLGTTKKFDLLPYHILCRDAVSTYCTIHIQLPNLYSMGARMAS
jgi:hypothetical protein